MVTQTTKQMKLGAILLICLSLAGQLCRAAQTYQFEPTNSLIQIHLGTSGVLRSAGHEHLIQTPVTKGTFVFDPRAPSQNSVEVVVDARQLKVMDPELSPRDKAKIQATMESDRVLGVQQFPTITFKSTSVEPAGDTQLIVRGNLSIKGKTSPITLNVRLSQQGSELTALGQSQFRQTQFGIKPVSVALGTVRVQDLMTIEFQIQGHTAR